MVAYLCEIDISVVSNHCMTMSFPVESQQSTRNGDSSSAPPFCLSVYSLMDSLVHLFLHAEKMICVPEPSAGLAGERERKERAMVPVASRSWQDMGEITGEGDKCHSKYSNEGLWETIICAQ